ncbi:ribokinase [Secundilactobacillus oryzae JCM 18671]|uniref:Deoxyribokinase n=1 Tax=Secundilactobacillus oryzae JCM 18671 TaxID=1291743 RepID=A0A081BGE9_9LACO|nr:ribokinase [Secundilactobacillus oryzae]GAK47117.1 ribokinase [Secundilactobacillus oryzae JCM 18671]
MADITVIGSNMIDLITYIDRMPTEGETISAPSFSMGFGGKGSNQAIAAARLGADVAMITAVGGDEFGAQQLDNYEKNGIGTETIIRGKANSGVAPIFVDPTSDNRIIIVKGANEELTPEALNQFIDVIQSSKLIVLQQEIPLETNYRAIEIANEANVPVLLNPAPAVSGIDKDFVTRVQFYAPNETELATITGMPVETLDDIKEAARTLVKEGVSNLIVTLGSKGVLWISPDDAKLIPAHKVDAVDTTGAGDSFIGAFANFYVAGESIPEALAHANDYSAVTVTRPGTQKSYPTAAELNR